MTVPEKQKQRPEEDNDDQASGRKSDEFHSVKEESSSCSSSSSSSSPSGSEEPPGSAVADASQENVGLLKLELAKLRQMLGARRLEDNSPTYGFRSRVGAISAYRSYKGQLRFRVVWRGFEICGPIWEDAKVMIGEYRADVLNYLKGLRAKHMNVFNRLLKRWPVLASLLLEEQRASNEQTESNERQLRAKRKQQPTTNEKKARSGPSAYRWPLVEGVPPVGYSEQQQQLQLQLNRQQPAKQKKARIRRAASSRPLEVDGNREQKREQGDSFAEFAELAELAELADQQQLGGWNKGDATHEEAADDSSLVVVQPLPMEAISNFSFFPLHEPMDLRREL